MLQQQFRRCFLVFLVGMICIVPNAFAQYAENDFTRYSVKDGLSDNGITCLQQDASGYLWIGTDAGLNRFDGNSFKQFYQGTAPLHLPSGSIVALKRFGPDQLGILSKGGFVLLNTRTNTVQNFMIPDSSEFSSYLNAVWDVVQLPDTSFAVTTAAGFYVFNAEGRITLRHDAYQIHDIGQKRILYGRDIFHVGENQYLICVEEDGLALYDDEKKTFRELRSTDTTWNIFSYARLQGDDYWVTRQQLSDQTFGFVPKYNDSIIYYDHASKKKVTSAIPFDLGDALNWESRIAIVNDSVFFINSRTKGFYVLHLNRATGHITCDGKLYLPNYKIICLFRDKDGRLWVGTSEGLLKQELQPPVLNAYRYLPPAGPQYTGGFSCTYRYKDLLYAGRFSRNNGLAIIRAHDMQLVRELSFYGEDTQWNEIRSIQMYYPDTLWIGTNTGLLWYDTNSDSYGKVLDESTYPWATEFSPVLAPAREDGYAWMCSLLDGKVVRYHLQSRTFTLFTSQTTPALPFDRVKSIAYDAYGDVWIGGHSLARWNNRTQDFDTMITVYSGANKYNENILTLSADTEGSLWLHNAYNGLLEYRIKEKTFVAYSMKDGLPSDVLQSLSPVIDRRMWIAANNQLALFDIRSKNFSIYDADDGFPEQKPTGRQIYYDAETGELYLCSNEYLVRFPFSPEEQTDSSSGLILQEVTIDNKKTFYQPEGELNLRYNENNLSLHYSVIDFEKRNYQFAYRLNPADQWNSVGEQHSINLTNLPPGEYSIQIRASGKPGIEKTAALLLVIHPPFWKETWFIGIISFLIAAGMYGLYWSRIQRIEQKANIDKQLSQTEMKALQAQMNPHFVFNSLNSIGEMILNNENKEASNYLSKFARLIRITLDQSSQSLVSLRSTIDYLERYMEMEKIRNGQFTHQIIIDPALDIDETFIPPMLIQPFIENAVWHGVSASRKNIHVRIDFKKTNKNLVCSIDDNGIGIHQTHQTNPEKNGRHQPVGIANIQNRVALLNEKYNLHCQISIVDKKDIPGCTDTGTRVTLQLPLEMEES